MPTARQPSADPVTPNYSALARACVLIPTHTTRHLAMCVGSLRFQQTPPHAVVVTCDNDRADIAALLDDVWGPTARALQARCGYAPVLLHAQRAHAGQARVNQVRNNGLRALDHVGMLRDPDIVIICDGDTMLAPDAITKHVARARDGADVTACYRIELTELQTQRVAESDMLASAERFASMMTESQSAERLARLNDRQARYERALRLRRWLPAWTGLVKPHKPKLLGGHHAVRVSTLRAINGYDERFEGYGFDDDDLSRRIHALRPAPPMSIGVRDIMAVHLWHPVRAPAAINGSAGHQTFCLPWTTRAAEGWSSPRAQSEVRVRVVTGHTGEHA